MPPLLALASLGSMEEKYAIKYPVCVILPKVVKASRGGIIAA